MKIEKCKLQICSAVVPYSGSNLKFAFFIQFSIFNFRILSTSCVGRILPEDLATTQEHAATHSALQHHFENMEQQREAGTLGMWVFLVTEIMFFGGMFLAYTLYRYKYPEAFAVASNHLDIKLGGINTAVLIVSSFTMAMAVFSTQVGKKRNSIIFLLMTMALA